MVVNVYRAKLVVVGDQAVGKTAVVQMLVSDGVNYPRNYNMTFAAEVNTKIVNIPSTDDAVELLIYDSPGFEAYTDYLDRFWNKPDLLMIVYDVTNKKSLDTCSYWLKRATEAEWRSSNGNPQAVVLFGNKSESGNRRACTQENGDDFAASNNMKHFIGSAKENQGIEEAMKYISEEFYNIVEKKTTPSLEVIIFFFIS